MIAKYGKGIGALIATALVAWIAARTDGSVSAAEWWTMGGSLAALVATVGIPNTVTNPAVKMVAQVAGILVGGIGATLSSGTAVDASVVVQLVVQAAGALGVYSIGNVGDDYAIARGRHLA